MNLFLHHSLVLIRLVLLLLLRLVDICSLVEHVLSVLLQCTKRILGVLRVIKNLRQALRFELSVDSYQWAVSAISNDTHKAFCFCF